MRLLAVSLNLHSDMVRFIIIKYFIAKTTFSFIYIPIWLDLLWSCKKFASELGDYLHSNMVRFIIENNQEDDKVVVEFTFQYG